MLVTRVSLTCPALQRPSREAAVQSRSDPFGAVGKHLTHPSPSHRPCNPSLLVNVWFRGPSLSQSGASLLCCHFGWFPSGNETQYKSQKCEKWLPQAFLRKLLCCLETQRNSFIWIYRSEWSCYVELNHVGQGPCTVQAHVSWISCYRQQAAPNTGASCGWDLESHSAFSTASSPCWVLD